ALGDKARAKELALASGVPCVPGSDGVVKTEALAVEVARKIGFPVIIKAVAGGGGRGLGGAPNQIRPGNGFHAGPGEAEAGVKNPETYTEKTMERPRHIEIQLLADRYGNIVHLGERDCSLQRRHQKLIEESPSPGLDPEIREAMGEAAKKLAL